VRVLAVVVVLALGGCADDASSGPDAGPTSSVTDGSTVDKVLVVVVENHSLAEMQDQMPYVAGLAARYGYADNYRASTHPSLPNYIAIAAGDMLGVTDDDLPEVHPLTGPSVFGEAIEQHRTAKVYADAMSSPCSTENDGTYVARHNPWTYFVDERSLCRAGDVPLDALAADVEAGNLPNVGMLVPDLCHDGHDCPLGTADAWIEQEVGLVLDGPDFGSGRLAVVITADEDDRTEDNKILTVVAQAGISHEVVHEALDHYSLARAYAEAAGVTPLRQAGQATSLLSAFGLAARVDER
jgi:acid phosphatase